MASITLQQVRKTYDNGYHAIRGIDIAINDGEFFVLVGPSGCGKTTALRMVAGLEDITGGDVLIGDRRVNDLPGSARDIAMVFQSYALYPHLNVYENLAFALRRQKLPRQEIHDRVLSALDVLGLEGIADRIPRQLSGGQRQRVALGRAMVRQPTAFLLDEPLSNLDAKLRGTMRVELKEQQRRLGTTSIYVTHDQVEAMTLGDRICVMAEGEVQQIGTPIDLYDRPANAFVAGFLGSPPMNLLGCRIHRSDDEVRLCTVAGTVIDLPPALAVRLSGIDNRPLVLGIRPEHVAISDGPAHLLGTVRMVEHLGNNQYIHLEVAGSKRPVTMTAPARSGFTRGECIALQIDTNHLLCFDGAGPYARNLLA